MGDYERSTTVDAPVDDLFEFLSKVENLPRYMERMTEAHSVTGDEVSVEARIDTGDGGPDGSADGGADGSADGGDGGERTVRGEAWFRIDADHRTLEWGAEGPHDYRGTLEVSASGSGSTVTVRLHTTREADGIQDGLDGTLANIRRLAGTGPGIDAGAGTG